MTGVNHGGASIHRTAYTAQSTPTTQLVSFVQVYFHEQLLARRLLQNRTRGADAESSALATLGLLEVRVCAHESVVFCLLGTILARTARLIIALPAATHHQTQVPAAAARAMIMEFITSRSIWQGFLTRALTAASTGGDGTDGWCSSSSSDDEEDDQVEGPRRRNHSSSTTVSLPRLGREVKAALFLDEPPAGFLTVLTTSAGPGGAFPLSLIHI